MKRKDVYGTLINNAKQELLQKPYDKKLIEKGVATGNKECIRVIDSSTNGIYSTGPDFKKEALLCIPFFILGLVVPVSIPLRLLIGFLSCAVVLFISNKGARFLTKDLANTLQFKDDIRMKYKPKYNKYEPVIIGYNPDSEIIIDLLKNNPESKGLENSKVYIADKEVLGDCIQSFVFNKHSDFDTTSTKLKEVIVNEYGKHSLNDLHDEELKKSNKF